MNKMALSSRKGHFRVKCEYLRAQVHSPESVPAPHVTAWGPGHGAHTQAQGEHPNTGLHRHSASRMGLTAEPERPRQDGAPWLWEGAPLTVVL